MAITVAVVPSVPASLVANVATVSGLAGATNYAVTIVGPNGTSTYFPPQGTTAVINWMPDGPGTYTFYTSLASGPGAAQVVGSALGYATPTVITGTAAFVVGSIN